MRDARSLDHQTLETYRFTALRLKKEGVAVEKIAKSLRVSTGAVYRWLKKAREKGSGSLKSRRALGPAPKMSQEQQEQLLLWLGQPAGDFGFSTDLWSGPRVGLLLKKQWGIDYHPKHMARLLRGLGYVLKFPGKRAWSMGPKSSGKRRSGGRQA